MGTGGQAPAVCFARQHECRRDFPNTLRRGQFSQLTATDSYGVTGSITLHLIHTCASSVKVATPQVEVNYLIVASSCALG